MLSPPSLEELLASVVGVVVGMTVGSLVCWTALLTGFGSSTYPNLCTTSEKEGLVAGAALATSSIDSSPPEPSVPNVCVEAGVGVVLDDGGGNLRRREDNLSWRAMISSPCCPTSAVSALTARSSVWNLPPMAMMLSIPSNPGARSFIPRISAGVSDSTDRLGEASGTVLLDRL